MAPTLRLILLLGAGAPAALAIALLSPGWWLVAALWIGLCLAAFAFDLTLAPPVSAARLSIDAPRAVGVGEDVLMRVAVATGGRGRPRQARIALSVDSRLARSGRVEAALTAGEDGGIGTTLTTKALRRGRAVIERAWVQWQGPLGLARVQRSLAADQAVDIVPSIRAVQEDAARLFARDAQIGQQLHARLGEGSEFESLVHFMPGFDRRAIDWKQSARHTGLLAKQFEVERDNHIVLAIDCGRMMSEPVVDADGIAEPRLDRATASALALAYVALRMEDRVSLASFAARPALLGREYARIGDFAALRRAVAGIDYAFEETNFTLGLATVAASLKRRAMIVLFTEFADANSAELMLAAAERLVNKHLLVFVVSDDTELEQIMAAVPDDAAAMTQATIAAELLRDRRVVLARLRRMGALVVEAPAAGLSARLLDTYVAIKRRGQL